MKPIHLGMMIVLGLCSAPPINAGDMIDLSTGRPVVMTPPTPPAPAPTRTQAGGHKILWDQSKGAYLQYTLDGNFSAMKADITAQGYTFTINTSPLDSFDLGAYDAIAISLGSNWNGAYTSAEATAIDNFVKSGKSLLILGDNLGCPNSNLNTISQKIGVVFGGSTKATSSTTFTSHPIFTGIGTITYSDPGNLTLSSPAVAGATTGSAIYVATSEAASCQRVVSLGDFNIFANSEYQKADNKTLTRNIFKWVTECSPVDNDGDGFPSTTDCNDNDAAIYPGATEVCDGKDNNCNGQTDEALLNTYYQDSDGDGVGSTSTTQACSKPSGYSTSTGDCNDNDAAIKPGVAEVCDGKDNNCNGQTDEGVLNTYYLDDDGDGFGDAGQPVTACSRPQGTSTTATDCDDEQGSVYPGAQEVCDGIDQDCDQQIDEGVTSTFYTDQDQDTFGDDNSAAQACSPGQNQTTSGGDCNDTNGQIHPGAAEICGDTIDQDCNGYDLSCSAVDKDQDGYTPSQGDCNDNDASIHPDATEIPYDGIDQDCQNGDLVDVDEDTFPGGEDGEDCDDEDPAIHPDAEEECDGIDNNCDGAIDNIDVDHDGEIDANCDGTDCNDLDPTVGTTMPEIPDGLDNDCDGDVDETGTDEDEDGYTVPEDCNDNVASIHPGADEIPGDGIDQNCDGVDEEVTPTEGTDTPEDGTDTPTDGTDTPTEGTDTPTEGTDTPTEGTDTPTEGTDTPTGGTDTLTEGTDTPTEVTDTPTEGTDTPTEVTDTPTEVTDTPTEVTDTPTEGTGTPEAELPLSLVASGGGGCDTSSGSTFGWALVLVLVTPLRPRRR